MCSTDCGKHRFTANNTLIKCSNKEKKLYLQKSMQQSHSNMHAKLLKRTFIFPFYHWINSLKPSQLRIFYSKGQQKVKATFLYFLCTCRKRLILTTISIDKKIHETHANLAMHSPIKLPLFALSSPLFFL